MSINTFQLWNRSFGWGVFTIALLTYVLTVEPTASFWDAGEYIATAAKLQVGHPPGAPLFQMIGAFFALFATSPRKHRPYGQSYVCFLQCFHHTVLILDIDPFNEKITCFRILGK